MNPIRQRILIAELSEPHYYGLGGTASGSRIVAAGQTNGEEPIWLRENGWSITCPDYLSDLNAMHKAEKGLRDEGSITAYMRAIEEVFARMDRKAPAIEHLYIRATAAQRAEAFLRALGKWEESA